MRKSTKQLGIDGASVLAKRESRGLTITGLAAMIGVSERTMYRIESGAIDARLSVVGRIADALGVDFTDLVRRKA